MKNHSSDEYQWGPLLGAICHPDRVNYPDKGSLHYLAAQNLHARGFLLPAQGQLMLAADLGHAQAHVELGISLLNGRFIDDDEKTFIKDDTRAVAHFRAAAEEPNVLGCLLCAKCYSCGIGVPTDPMKAEMYINRVPPSQVRKIFMKNVTVELAYLDAVKDLLLKTPIIILFLAVREVKA